MKEAGSNPFFDSLNSILTNKKYWLNEQTEKEYAPLGVNVGLSQHIDAILHVNELNKFWLTLTPIMHYDYCFYAIRKMKRKFGKWSKKRKVKDEIDLTIITQHYNISYPKAVEYFDLLSEDQIKELRQLYEAQ